MQIPEEVLVSNPVPANFRVCHILSGKTVWGTENYVFNLFNELKSLSIDTHLICANEGMISSKFQEAGVDVDILKMNGYSDLSAVLNLASILKEKNIDILHTHLGLDSFLGSLASSIANIPMISSVHFDKPSYVSISSPIVRHLWTTVQKIKNQRIAHFLPITQNVAHELSNRESVPLHKLTVVHPGIPPFESSNLRRNELRVEFGAQESDIVLISLGRLQPEKNFPYLLDSMRVVNQARNNIKLWIVGEGFERQKLQRIIEENELADSVKMMGYRADAKELLSAADIFVLPSKAEPFGMAAVEAMFVELPVIGTRGPGLSTIVEHNQTGILVDPDQVKSMSDAIIQLSGDPDLRRNLGKAGRVRALNTFTSEIMASKITTIYERLVSDSKATV